ncbi:MAG: hypothetical protein IJ643_11685 [Eubacterium sp.]|nr:hypothetical protein [Eubacterium sp.]MBR1761906.1 hypothetical protein [Eubacterium sp.]
MANYKVLIYQDIDLFKDITELTQKVVWGGRDGNPSRTLDVTIIDSEQFARANIDIVQGWYCRFYWNGEELFRGIITKTNPSSKGTMTFKAYDYGFYLSRNKDAFHYKKKTATSIFKDICNRFGLSVGSAAKCKKTISEISKNATAWDIIQTALQEEYQKTGVRHAVYFEKGKAHLIVRRENIVKWLLETDTNIISWTFSKSIEKVTTRMKLYSSESKTLATAKDASLEKKIGIFQDINKPDDSVKKKSKLNSLANSLLKEAKNPEVILNITAQGIISMRTGRGAFVIIPALNIKQSFYIVQDTHTFQGEKYTMSLKLEKTTDLKY